MGVEDVEDGPLASNLHQRGLNIWADDETPDAPIDGMRRRY